ncbi:MAG TPA: DUF4097 family beta strand repeat-containing protein [Candidatus Cloacimonadota bacterium]|nr:DUF4097 family beta strand repeat-containing protein [Candidatus Cloacimonadota bacterium]
MKRLIIIGLIALVLTSCVIHVGYQPDGDLEYYNEALLYQVCDFSQLQVSTSTATIELEGSDDNHIDLVVGFYEYTPGDAVIYIENGTIKARSASGKQVLITEISGEIPQWLDLKVSNASGNIDISDMQDSQQIYISNASGDFFMEDSQAAEIDIQVGSGKVYLVDNAAYEIKIRAGSGDVYLQDSEVTEIEIEAGSGDVTFEDSELINGSVTTGSGDIILKNTEAGYVKYRVGSGEIKHLH